MQVMVNHKTLTKALDTPSSRVVLGNGVNGFVKVIFVLWGACFSYGIACAESGSMPFPGATNLTLFIRTLAGPVGLVCLLVYLLVGGKSRLILDLTNYTYLHEFGLSPLMKRRRGHLDAFSHLSLTRQMETQIERSMFIWKLALIPRADAPATEPIVITFEGGEYQTATATVALSQRLAEHVALPLHNECTYNW